MADSSAGRDPAVGKSMAKWGAVGAVLAIPVPFVGPVVGAILGAGVGYARAKRKQG